jgi:hypothetical protein
MPEALANFASICGYLETAWTENEVRNFVQQTDRLIHLLSQGNVSFQRSAQANCHRVPITPHNMLYYRISGDVLEILTIWDTRQDPLKNRREDGSDMT